MSNGRPSSGNTRGAHPINPCPHSPRYAKRVPIHKDICNQGGISPNDIKLENVPSVLQ